MRFIRFKPTNSKAARPIDHPQPPFQVDECSLKRLDLFEGVSLRDLFHEIEERERPSYRVQVCLALASYPVADNTIVNQFRQRAPLFPVITGNAYLSIESRENAHRGNESVGRPTGYLWYRGNSISTKSRALEFILEEYYRPPFHRQQRSLQNGTRQIAVRGWLFTVCFFSINLNQAVL